MGVQSSARGSRSSHLLHEPVLAKGRRFVSERDTGKALPLLWVWGFGVLDMAVFLSIIHTLRISLLSLLWLAWAPDTHTVHMHTYMQAKTY